MMRVIAVIIFLLLSTLVSPWLLLPFAAIHALAWFALELVFIGAALDAFFGVHYVFPYYTVAAVCLIVFCEWFKPHLSFYTE